MNFYSDGSSKYLSAFLVADLVGLPIHIIHSDGTVIYVNKTWVQTYRIEPREVIGKHVNTITAMLLPESGFSYEVSSLSGNVLSEAKPVIHNFASPLKESPAIIAAREQRQVTLICREKSGHIMLCQSSPIYDGRGNVVNVLTTIQNVSLYNNWQTEINTPAEVFLPQSIPDDFSHLIGNSQVMRQIKALITLVSKTDATALISGESGCGKEIVAKEIYLHSVRKAAPFVAVNCAAIPKDLIEAELFGFEKGAFTGAHQRHIGLFEQANGGTLLLDEIGELPLSLQPKLLRVLQEQELSRIGGTERIPLDVRIIAATNQNLQELVKNGSFRSDLYYRLNVFPIEVPPLRSRGNDISLLSLHFLEKFNQKYRMNKTFSPQALQFMQQYTWPGNVRELENFVERLVIIVPTYTIHVETIRPLLVQQFNNTFPDPVISTELSLKQQLQDYEREIIQQALQRYKSTYKVAEALKTSQSTIVRRIQQLGIKSNYQ